MKQSIDTDTRGGGHRDDARNGTARQVTYDDGPDPAPGQPTSIPVDWERLARATVHPLQIAVLEILGLDGGRVLSPTDLGKELQIPVTNTNYHVTALAEMGLLVMVDQQPVRGTTEHFYELAPAAPR